VKLSVHFVERSVRFVFDALTTDNLTGIWQKWKHSVPRYSTNLRRIIWVGSPKNWRWKNILLRRIRRRFCVDPRVHVDRCITRMMGNVLNIWNILEGLPPEHRVKVIHTDEIFLSIFLQFLWCFSVFFCRFTQIGQITI
jgi:hypothetical protein